MKQDDELNIGDDEVVKTEAGAESLLKTEQLIADVIAAGGRLILPDKTSRGGVDWRQRAYAAQSQGRVPPGKKLSVSRTSTSFEIELLDAPNESALELLPVPVPSRLGKYHPLAKEFRDRVELHEISRRALPRVLRIVHGLAVEGERRSYRAACVSARFDTYGRSEWKPSRDGQLVFTINGCDLPVRIWEIGVELRGPYEVDLERWRQDRERPVREMLFLSRPKPYDSAATGELNIEALGRSLGRPARWRDRQRWRLEDRLPHLLRELETQAVEEEERRLAKEREAAERRRQWEAAMEDAKRRLASDHLVDVLTRRVAAWEQADAIRHYCEAVEERHGDSISLHSDTAEWLAFARRYADQLQELPRMPAGLEATPDNLKPYLGKWSPYGPDRW